jgi:transcription elongation factor GreA-like protein
MYVSEIIKKNNKIPNKKIYLKVYEILLKTSYFFRTH